MAVNLADSGPKMDWTRDNRIYDRFSTWKTNVECYFDSVLADYQPKQKVALLRLWLGNESHPLVQKWISTGKLDFSSAEEKKNDRGQVTQALSSGYILDTWWTLLEEELKPKGNRIISIIDWYSPKSKQGSRNLNEWLTYVYNLADACNYKDSRDRMIRDLLIVGCNSTSARDKIVRKGENITLLEVIELLQVENSTHQTLQEMNSTTQKVHYASYDKKKSKGKKKGASNPNPANSTSSNSTAQKPNSTGKLCFRCKAPFSKEHIATCKAEHAICNGCGVKGHFQKACKQAGNFPNKQKSHSTGRIHTATATAVPEGFYNEKGDWVSEPPRVQENAVQIAQQHVVSTHQSKGDILIEFGAGLTTNSIDRKLLLKVDTGSDVNAINYETFQALFPGVQLQASSVILENFDKSLMSPIGCFKCFLRWKGKLYRIKVEVMKDSANVLSRETTFLMGILKMQLNVEKVPIEQNSTVDRSTSSTSTVSTHSAEMGNNLKKIEFPSTEASNQSPLNSRNPANTVENSSSSESTTSGSKLPSISLEDGPLTKESVTSVYSDVFQGLGKFPGDPYKLRLKPNSTPARHKPRKVPVHLQEAFHEEVKRLVEIDVLEPVYEQTEWVNSFVVVEKTVEIDSSNAHSPNHRIKKQIRLCIDPKDLNEALEREPYYSRSIDELIEQLNGAIFFTIVDMDKGYWQVVLHPESRKYTCMAFDIGRYQFKRLPMGSKIASDIFQKKLDSVYIGLPGVTGIADDMIVYGRTEEEHDRNLILFLETTRSNGLVLNKKKLQFKQKEVSFFGHRWSPTGISPDPKKVDSILRMEFPQDKETMHSFLGLVNFLNRYTPRLAELCAPLRKLILKDSHFAPGTQELAAFEAIKAEFKQKIELPFFDKNKDSVLQTDASKKGFGAVLLQNNHPIYYASRTLTSAEKNYQNLEREAMAAVWGMEKFHYFLYGRQFILQTDQKPLVSIFRKHMIDVSPRIQRIAIRAWQYDFIPEYLPGKQNVISDALSRVTPLEFQESDTEKEILVVNLLQYSTIEQREKDLLLQATDKDAELQSLKQVISTGWPAKRSKLPQNLHAYWDYRDELTVESGILMKNSKVLIPDSLKQKYINEVHSGHMGVEATLKKAREFIFWKGYSADIQEAVEKCGICQSQDRRSSTRQKYVSEVPPHPWHTLGSDLFYFKRNDFLIVVDYFSKFLIVRKIPNSTSSAVIKELELIFSEFGRPFIFRSDNGPCYSSEEFKFFMQNWLIEHRTSSPHYPQSNGLAESMVKVSKNLIEKALLQDLPWNRSILDYRCTPISSDIPSPAEILFGRRFRSSISILPSQVMNDRISTIRELIAKKEGKYHPYSDPKNPILPLEPGQNVWLQDSISRQWEEAVVREKCKEPNSYMVETPSGSILRRNSNFLKPRPAASEQNSNSTPPETIQQAPVEAEIPPAAPSGPTTSTVDVIPTVPPALQKRNSTPAKVPTPRQSTRSTKGVPPNRLGLPE